MFLAVKIFLPQTVGFHQKGLVAGRVAVVNTIPISCSHDILGHRLPRGISQKFQVQPARFGWGDRESVSQDTILTTRIVTCSSSGIHYFPFRFPLLLGKKPKSFPKNIKLENATRMRDIPGTCALPASRK